MGMYIYLRACHDLDSQILLGVKPLDNFIYLNQCAALIACVIFLFQKDKIKCFSLGYIIYKMFYSWVHNGKNVLLPGTYRIK